MYVSVHRFIQIHDAWINIIPKLIHGWRLDHKSAWFMVTGRNPTEQFFFFLLLCFITSLKLVSKKKKFKIREIGDLF